MKLIILDRDGVINHDSDQYIKSPEEWIPIDGSLQAIAQLNSTGHKVCVATNQSGIARGYYDTSTLNKIHDKMNNLLKKQNAWIDYLTYCPHLPHDNCDCRKPKPGMLLDIIEAMGVKKIDTIFIGDTLGDMRAAEQAGVKFGLVKSGKGERTISENPEIIKKVGIFNDLLEFTNTLLSASPPT